MRSRLWAQPLIRLPPQIRRLILTLPMVPCQRGHKATGAGEPGAGSAWRGLQQAVLFHAGHEGRSQRGGEGPFQKTATGEWLVHE